MNALLDLVLDFILSPVLWMCVLFGVVYAVLFTLWRGGGLGQLLRDMVAGIVGFGLGQLIASLTGLFSPRVGDVHLLWGSLFCVLGLLVGRRYWRPQGRSKPGKGAAGVETPPGGSPAP